MPSPSPALPPKLLKAAVATLVLGTLMLFAIAEQDQSGALGLTYGEFDQTPHSGWRVLAEEKRFREAAALIEAYLHRHPELDRFQRANLHFHAAQVLAMARNTPAALKHLPSARLDPEPPDSPVRWNDYVAATAAFLQRDRTRLLAARNRIASGTALDGEIPNLRVVESLLAHFDQSYAAAYQATGR